MAIPRSTSANASVTQNATCKVTVKAIQTAPPITAPNESPSSAEITAMNRVIPGTAV